MARKSIFYVLFIIGSFAGGAVDAAEEGGTSDWAVPVSHFSGQTVILIGNQKLVLEWNLDPVAVQAEMAMFGVGAQQLQIGLVLDGEFMRAQDFPKGGALLRWHLELFVTDFLVAVQAQLYVSAPDGPVGRMTRPLELHVRQIRSSDYSEMLDNLKAEEEGGARQGDAPPCPDAHVLDEKGGECLPGPGDLAAAQREKAGVFSSWDAPADVVALRKVLDDVNLRVVRLHLGSAHPLRGTSSLTSDP